jgi:uncharacterized protein GlcG (DUF336 family)
LAALEQASSEGFDASVAVVDVAGRSLAFIRSARSPFHCDAIASDKAYTAAAFGVPTHSLAQTVAGNATLQHGLTVRPRMVLFAGGLPILSDGVVIGGIGVSGGSEEQDTSAARAGLAAICLSQSG